MSPPRQKSPPRSTLPDHALPLPRSPNCSLNRRQLTLRQSPAQQVKIPLSANDAAQFARAPRCNDNYRSRQQHQVIKTIKAIKYPNQRSGAQGHGKNCHVQKDIKAHPPAITPFAFAAEYVKQTSESSAFAR